MHNAAQRAFEDLLMFTWPLGLVVLRIGLFSRREDRFKALELIVSVLGLISLSFFLLDDGALLTAISKAHPAWGASLLLAAALALVSITLSWRQGQSDNDQLSRGVLDAQITDIKVGGLRPRIFAGAAAAVAIFAVGWLYLISKTAG